MFKIQYLSETYLEMWNEIIICFRFRWFESLFILFLFLPVVGSKYGNTNKATSLLKFESPSDLAIELYFCISLKIALSFFALAMSNTFCAKSFQDVLFSMSLYLFSASSTIQYSYNSFMKRNFYRRLIRNNKLNVRCLKNQKCV